MSSPRTGANAKWPPTSLENERSTTRDDHSAPLPLAERMEQHKRQSSAQKLEASRKSTLVGLLKRICLSSSYRGISLRMVQSPQDMRPRIKSPTLKAVYLPKALEALRLFRKRSSAKVDICRLDSNSFPSHEILSILEPELSLIAFILSIVGRMSQDLCT